MPLAFYVCPSDLVIYTIQYEDGYDFAINSLTGETIEGIDDRFIVRAKIEAQKMRSLLKEFKKYC